MATMTTLATPVLTPKEIKAFVQALNAFHWKGDYKQFCQVLGYAESSYSLRQYEEFEHLCKALSNFNVNSLTKLAEAGAIADRS